MRIVVLHPRPLEVAVARVPAGMAVRAIRDDGSAREFPPDPAGLTRWVQAPGGGLPWGTAWSSWYGPAGIARYRHKRDREVWQEAARLLRKGDGPSVLYVVHEQAEYYGKTVWQAVSVRTEGS